MNLIKISFWFLVIILSSNNFAQNFEGKVAMKISDEDMEENETANIDYFIKGNKMRMEMKSEEGKFIILYDQKDSKT